MLRKNRRINKQKIKLKQIQKSQFGLDHSLIFKLIVHEFIILFLYLGRHFTLTGKVNCLNCVHLKTNKLS